ncbi:MAG: hypothetical protein GXY06_01465 [Clostridiaceae bacterium]|nr:hypothetical protein [Clostridiaceae bacterium]
MATTLDVTTTPGVTTTLGVTTTRNVSPQAITAISCKTSGFGGKYMHNSTNPAISHTLDCDI